VSDLIYSLAKDKEDSSEYYRIIKKVSRSVNETVKILAERYINEFISFLKENKIEKIRSFDEYLIEFMLIGVLVQEYNENAISFKGYPLVVFNFFNKLRDKKRGNKKIVDAIRGFLAGRILVNTKNNTDEYTFNDFKALLKWLKAAYEFKEEILRLENWLSFLNTKKISYSNHMIGKAVDASLFLYEIGNEYLAGYLSDIEGIVKSNYKTHKNKEDIILCTKGRLQYYFNMISAEIMNGVYEEAYSRTTEKMILLPTCMKQKTTKCHSIETPNGRQCKNCSELCNINRIDTLAKEKGIRVFSIEHGSMLFEAKSRRRRISTGVIGVACILNLMSGGWKAVRLGYVPQCIVLETCGCGHWREQAIVTDINEKFRI
jgi:hypothetical protein